MGKDDESGSDDRSPDTESDPLLQLRGTVAEIWAGEHADE
jgi:hypothetical protein